ncbi:MAG: hypothetical protein Q9217_002312 [Psora testacea]
MRSVITWSFNCFVGGIQNTFGLQERNTILADRCMCQSLAQAIKSDTTLLSESLAEEAAAARDRALAHRLAGTNAPSAAQEQTTAGCALDDGFMARLAALYVTGRNDEGDAMENTTQNDSPAAAESSAWAASRHKPSTVIHRQCTVCDSRKPLFDAFQTRADTLLPRILTAKASKVTNELSILNRLSQDASSNPESKYVMNLLGNFKQNGPNGTHLCLVFEAMGPNVASMVESFQSKDRYMGWYPKWVAKEVARFVASPIYSLKVADLVRDLQMGNILFSAPDLESVDEAVLQEDLIEPVVSERVKRLDGEMDMWSPEYLAVPQPLTSRTHIVPGFTIRISDLGGGQSLCPVLTVVMSKNLENAGIAFLFSNPPKHLATPAALRAPELVLGAPVDQSIDVWSLGCLVSSRIRPVSGVVDLRTRSD